jgi:hypothetical protein
MQSSDITPNKMEKKKIDPVLNTICNEIIAEYRKGGKKLNRYYEKIPVVGKQLRQ